MDRDKIKKEHYPFYDWEDHKNGMYANRVDGPHIDKSKFLLSNSRRFREACVEMLFKWKVSAKENLTDANKNRRAWLGQAACCFNHKATERETKHAWKRMSEDQQKRANAVADKIILEWVINHRDQNEQYEFIF